MRDGSGLSITRRSLLQSQMGLIRSAHSPRPSGADANAAGEKNTGMYARHRKPRRKYCKTPPPSPAKADTWLRREVLPAEDGTLRLTDQQPEPTHRQALAVPTPDPDRSAPIQELHPPSEGTDAVGGGRRGRGKEWFRIRTLFADERCSQATAYGCRELVRRPKRDRRGAEQLGAEDEEHSLCLLHGLRGRRVGSRVGGGFALSFFCHFPVVSSVRSIAFGTQRGAFNLSIEVGVGQEPDSSYIAMICIGRMRLVAE